MNKCPGLVPLWPISRGLDVLNAQRPVQQRVVLQISRPTVRSLQARHHASVAASWRSCKGRRRYLDTCVRRDLSAHGCEYVGIEGAHVEAP